MSAQMIAQTPCESYFPENRYNFTRLDDTCRVHVRPYSECVSEMRRELTAAALRLAVHHFGDHGEECDDCRIPDPAEGSLTALRPYGFVSESGSTMHGGRLFAFIDSLSKEEP